MLHSLPYMIYGMGWHPSVMSRLRLAALVFQVNQKRPIRREGVPLTGDHLFFDLIYRLQANVKLDPILRDVAYSYIRQLEGIDSCLAFFVLTATYTLPDDLLMESLRRLSIHMELVMVPLRQGPLELRSSDIPLYQGLPRIPWDITPVLNDRLWLARDELRAFDPLSIPLTDDSFHLTSQFSQCILSEPLRAYQKISTRKRHPSTPSAKDNSKTAAREASTTTAFEYSSFTTEDTIFYLANMLNDCSSELFQQTVDSVTDYKFSLQSNVQIADCYDLSSAKVMLSPIVELTNKVRIAAVSLRNLDMPSGSAVAILRDASLDVYKKYQTSIWSSLREVEDVPTALKMSRLAATAILHVLTHCATLIKIKHLAAVALYDQLRSLSLAVCEDISAYYNLLADTIKDHIIREISRFVYSGEVSSNTTVFVSDAEAGDDSTEKAEQCNQELGISVISMMGVSIYCSSSLPPSLCELIIADAILLRELRQLVKFQKLPSDIYDESVLEAHDGCFPATAESLDRRLCWKCALLYVKDGCQMSEQIEQLIQCRSEERSSIVTSFLSQLRTATSFIADVFFIQDTHILHELGLKTARDAVFLRNYLRRKGYGDWIAKNVDVLEDDNNHIAFEFKPPSPISLVVSNMQMSIFARLHIVLSRLSKASKSLVQLDLRNLQFVLGDDRRVLFAARAMLRVVNGLLDHALQNSAHMIDTCNAKLDAATSVRSAMFAYRNLAKAAKRRVLMASDGPVLSSTIRKMCACTDKFVTAFAIGDARNCEQQYEEFRECAHLLSEKLVTLSGDDSLHLLYQLDMFDGAFVSQCRGRIDISNANSLNSLASSTIHLYH